MNKCKIGWHKLDTRAIIPTKRNEDAGFDIYTIEREIILAPHETRLFSTGIAMAVNEGYWVMAKDRGSTGSIGLHTHCGVIDSGYRGEIFICINNNNNIPVIFTDAVKKTTREENCIKYPTSKGIAQLIVVPQPEVESIELGAEEFAATLNTERGTSKLGASGK